MAETRRCPVPGCNATVEPGKLMCLRCWRQVPRAIQSRVYATWRQFLSSRRATTEEAKLQALGDYNAARSAAISSVVEQRP
ncbi:hypothetical protein SAMN06265365_1655 [Tistlia consotensis]|uniref:Uncharacterized protein n=1 Tax=Tistlia consotensis USBA 355 TaxID=560819 RepID=A0A1Y6CXC8_9PROT|nr:hypothetical protein [Tistlia consotensis]SMF85852.1 hypothetical protein SAMN05428998_1731 [Tistlia consotensis USBA 355]SNS39743.1 hypothetical protein SAMN06265365_1655 [Tistlia consotensis]